MGIPAERLREGQQILVRGKISYSRLASLIEGAALERSIEQAKKRGSLYPTKTPHTTIQLIDTQVVSPTAPNLTLEEQFVQEKMFTVKQGDNAGRIGFGLDNKSTYLPTILEMDPEHPGQYRQLVLERDLASGLDVTIVINVFKNGEYEKRGLGLQQVVLHEPVRYYASGVDANALAARGIVVNGAVRPVAAASAAAATAASAPSAAPAAGGWAPDAAQQQYPANTAADPRGYAAPMPGAMGTPPAPNIAAQAFPTSAPVAQPVAAPAPAAPPAPVATAAAPVETPEQVIARLQQQLAEQQAAQNGSGGASAFDAAPAAATTPTPTPGAGASPWDVPSLVGAGGSYQG